MLKQLLSVFLLIFPLFFAPGVFAKGLDVSKNSNFSSSDLDFAGGETVYARLSAADAPSHVLNIKDNNYVTVKSVDLAKNGSTYNASFAAPSGAGYYSLEAKIEGDGVSVTNVKTIKVGLPSNASVKVNINSKVEGTSLRSAGQNSAGQAKSQTDKEISTESPAPPASSEVYKTEKGIFTQIGDFFSAAISFLWPF